MALLGLAVGDCARSRKCSAASALCVRAAWRATFSAPIIVLTQVLARLKINLFADMFS